MHYELGDGATGNCVGWYRSKNDAKSRVRSLLEQFGASYADDLELREEDDLESFRGTATGARLIAQAYSVVTTQ